jgi:glycosyltransferase involved in cell wall biosynthesis
MKKLLVIGYVWPEPDSSAAGSRMLQILDIFLQERYQVTFASPALESDHMVNLQSLGIEKVKIELNSSSFDFYVKQLNPDVVLFDRFMMEEQFSWRVEAQCPSALRILETSDLHCLRYARHEALKANGNLDNPNYVNDIALREVASILRCDLSLMISDVEIEILKTIYNVAEGLLFYLPFMYEQLDTDIALNTWTPFEKRSNLVTIGNFRHEPNWDSILYLKHEIWPRISAKLKNVEMHVYGAYTPKKATQLHNPKERFYVKGWADDVTMTLNQYRLCLAPLRFGAGLKGKLANAMLCGTPSVTTTIGAEGMHHRYDWPGKIADNPAVFSDAVIELYNNKKEWEKCQVGGIEIVNKLFNKKLHSRNFIEIVNSLLNSLEQQRQKNFTGLMLRHHFHKSTKYMSQWIEAKNKLTN